LCINYLSDFMREYPEIENQTIDIDGQEMYVAVRKGTDPLHLPLLCINGIGANVELLYPFMVHIDPKITTIGFDVPGIGSSPLPTFPYRMPGLVSIISKVLDKLGYSKVVVLGVSWGGAVAQEFAHMEKEKCQRLILAATSPGMFMIPGKPSVLLKMATPLRYFSPAFMQYAAPHIYGGDMRDKPDAILEHMGNIKMQGVMGYVYQLLAGLGWTSLPWLYSLKQETLILAGDDDPIVPLANAKILNALIPNSTLKVFQGGHLFALTQAKEVVPLVNEFIANATVEQPEKV